MREGIGGIQLFLIVVILILVFAGIMSLTINHSNAFAVNILTQTPLNCVKRVNRLNCETPEVMPGGTNKIYYWKDNQYYYFTIPLYYSGSKQIYEVTKFVREDGYTCGKTSFNAFYISTIPSFSESNPIFYLIRKSDVSDNIKFSCSTTSNSGYSYKCTKSDSSKTIGQDDYILSSFGINNYNNPVYYDLSKINNVLKVTSSIELVQKKTDYQTLNKNNQIFTLTLLDTNLPLPSVYIDKDLTKKVPCTNTNKILYCKSDLRLMPKSLDYPIYY